MRPTVLSGSSSWRCSFRHPSGLQRELCRHRGPIQSLNDVSYPYLLSHLQRIVRVLHSGRYLAPAYIACGIREAVQRFGPSRSVFGFSPEFMVAFQAGMAFEISSDPVRLISEGSWGNPEWANDNGAVGANLVVHNATTA
jgi:hypothetical protein